MINERVLTNHEFRSFGNTFKPTRDKIHAMKPHDLHERLIDFAVMIINLAKDIETSKAGNHLTGQIIRSGSSPSLNYSSTFKNIFYINFEC